MRCMSLILYGKGLLFGSFRLNAKQVHVFDFFFLICIAYKNNVYLLLNYFTLN